MMKQKRNLAEGNFIGFPVAVAVVFGLNEAIFLNQLHYWTQRSTNEKEGFIWVYKTIDEWLAEFPFWSDRTIKRIKKELEEQQLIFTANFNKMKMDRTLWYRINYELIDKRLNEALGHFVTIDSDKMAQPLGQVVTMESDKSVSPLGQVVTLEEDKMAQAITIDYSETTTNKKTIVQHAEHFSSWWNLYAKKRGRAKCEIKFKTLLKKYDYAVIEEGTKRYLDYLQRNNIAKQYKKDPITFLNGEHFMDEYENSQGGNQAVNAGSTMNEFILNLDED